MHSLPASLSRASRLSLSSDGSVTPRSSSSLTSWYSIRSILKSRFSGIEPGTGPTIMLSPSAHGDQTLEFIPL